MTAVAKEHIDVFLRIQVIKKEYLDIEHLWVLVQVPYVKKKD